MGEVENPDKKSFDLLSVFMLLAALGILVIFIFFIDDEEKPKTMSWECCDEICSKLAVFNGTCYHQYPNNPLMSNDFFERKNNIICEFPLNPENTMATYQVYSIKNISEVCTEQ